MGEQDFVVAELFVQVGPVVVELAELVAVVALVVEIEQLVEYFVQPEVVAVFVVEVEQPVEYFGQLVAVIADFAQSEVVAADLFVVYLPRVFDYFVVFVDFEPVYFDCFRLRHLFCHHLTYFY